jgi:hypothetical protein
MTARLAFPQRMDAEGKTQILQGAAALTLTGAVAFTLLFLARAGLGDNAGAVAKLFALAILPVWLSAAALLQFGRSVTGAACALITGFAAGSLLPVAALVLGPAVTMAALALLAGALLVQGRSLAWAMGLRPFSIALTALPLAVAFLLFTAPTRLFMPEAIATGLALSDNYYDIAIAQMLGHYGAISTGGDGLELHSYHFLSQLIAAGSARAAAISVPAVYLYWAGLSLKLQLVWAVFAAGVLLAPGKFLQRLLYAGLVLLLLGGLESESFMQGAALYAATLPLLLALATETESPPPAWGIVLAVVAVLLCAFAKISAGFFGGVALLAVLWRLRKQRGHAVLLVAGLLLIAPPVYFLVLPKDISFAGAPLVTRLYDYYQNYFVLATGLSYLLPILVIALLELRPHMLVADGGMTIRWTRVVPRNAWSDAGPATRITVLTLAACILVLTTQWIGSNIAYFSAYLYLLALLLLPVALRQGDLTPPPALATGAIALVLGWMLTVSTVPFVAGLTPFLSSLYRAASGQGASYAGHVATELRQSRHETGAPFGTLRRRIEAMPWERLMAVLEQSARAQDGRLAVQIAPDADDAWRRLREGTTWWCMAPHMMIPAEIGLAEIRSMAPKTIEQACAPPGILWYGFGADQDRHRAADLSDAALCALARPMRVRVVYVLHSYQDLSRNRQVSCGAP